MVEESRHLTPGLSAIRKLTLSLPLNKKGTCVTNRGSDEPDRLTRAASPSPAQSDTPTGVGRRAQCPALFFHWRRDTSCRENLFGPRLRFWRFIHAKRKPSEGRAKEWSRCLAVQVVRKRRRWEACLSEAGDRNNREVFRRC
jgi:hypothetical protein